MKDFQSRFGAALQRRLYPNTRLHLKEIAGSIARSENTVARWWRGETRVLAEDVCRIAEFFHRRGDTRFLHDVFGDLLASDAALGASDENVLAVVRAVTAGMSDNAIRAERYVWLTATGGFEVAHQGHAEYVRRSLGTPDDAGDVVGYATRVLGWIAVAERTDGVVVIRHDGRRIAPLAAERACDWLEDRNDSVIRVRRLVQIDSRWVATQHSGAHAAAFAIAKLASIVQIPRPRWRVERLSLDTIHDERLLALLQIYGAAPQTLVHSAAEMGAFTTTSLFRVEGDDVISNHVATGFGFETVDVEGLNILARPDTEYALMVQARMLMAKREGPSYHELCGTIDDSYVRYLNLALPETGPGGRVLSSTVMLEKQRLAA